HSLLQPLVTVRRLVTLPPVLVAVAIYLLVCLSGRVSLPVPFGGYNGHRWGALLVLALIAVGGQSLPDMRALRLALVAVGLVSTGWAPYPIEALAVLATHAGLLLLAWVVARSVQAHGLPVLRGWCTVALAAALLYSAI